MDPFKRSSVSATTPAAPSGGSGPVMGGNLSVVDFSSARNDISDAMAGRVTLAMLDLIVLALIGFYLFTKSAQGGS
jgi:hypothetical protein